jgi:hypothetical protein
MEHKMNSFKKTIIDAEVRIEYDKDRKAKIFLNGKELDGVRSIFFNLTPSDSAIAVVTDKVNMKIFPSDLELRNIGLEEEKELLCLKCGNSNFYTTKH